MRNALRDTAHRQNALMRLCQIEKAKQPKLKKLAEHPPCYISFHISSSTRLEPVSSQIQNLPS